jgi:hypothetical protein
MNEEQVLRNLAWVQNPAHPIVCHHTVTHFEPNGTGRGLKKQVCAGALIFQQKAGLPNYFAMACGLQLKEDSDVYSSLQELAASGVAMPAERAAYVRGNRIYGVRLRLGRRMSLTVV